MRSGKTATVPFLNTHNNRLFRESCPGEAVFFMKKKLGVFLSGAAAGSVSGFFGAGGGSLLLPMLQALGKVPEKILFPSGLGIMVPICFVSLLLSRETLPLSGALPYLLGSFAGGFLSGRVSVKPKLLHRLLGLLMLFSGGRLLWS